MGTFLFILPTAEVEIKQGTLEINNNGETTQLQWALPSGPHTALYVSQRRESSEACMLLLGRESSSMSNSINCHLHNVTGHTNDTFNSSLGTVFSLQVYQGYDLVDEQEFSMGSNGGGSKNKSGR